MYWTRFTDMLTGGELKTEAGYLDIYIEGANALDRFEEEFGQSPMKQSCDCCDFDFGVTEHDTLKRACAYHRGCEWDEEKETYVGEEDAISVKEYVEKDHVCIITEDGDRGLK